jgi:hypothetical protein
MFIIMGIILAGILAFIGYIMYCDISMTRADKAAKVDKKAKK